MKTIVVAEPLKSFGLDLISNLVRLGYLIICVAPDSKECENIKKSVIKRYSQAKIEVFVGDWNSIKEIRQIMLNIRLILTNYRLDSIYAFIGNHQIFKKEYELNEDDIEVQFFENYLVNFIMAYTLLPYLQKEKNSKIILPTLSAKECGELNLNDLYYSKKYNGAQAYKSAKLCNALMACEFNKRFNIGENPVETILYQEKVVEKEEELFIEPKVKGLKKLFYVDRLFNVCKGIEAILRIKKHEKNELCFKFSKASKLPSVCENEEICNKLFQMSEYLGKLKYL